uniref:Tetraspanin 13 n=1 Tax=Panthera leo TaxID=9689 RepID=A0A8C8WQ88_PANLE
MVCGGFACSKNCLCALNLLYTLVSLLLIGIAAWGIGFGLISSLRVVGVVIAVGIFLFLIALVGLIGAVKHHQVLLFFYMIILLLVFVVQFSVSCACLALNEEQQGQLLEVGWNNTASARNDIQRNLNCCGFRTYNPNDTCLASCVKSSHPCSLCAPIIGKYAGEVLRFVGGIGLFFSFTEVLNQRGKEQLFHALWDRPWKWRMEMAALRSSICASQRLSLHWKDVRLSGNGGVLGIWKSYPLWSTMSSCTLSIPYELLPFFDNRLPLCFWLLLLTCPFPCP